MKRKGLLLSAVFVRNFLINRLPRSLENRSIVIQNIVLNSVTEEEMMPEPPYLKPNRLLDAIAITQFVGNYRKEKLKFHDSNQGKKRTQSWDEMMGTGPLNAEEWRDVLKEHPEFFSDRSPRE